MLKIINRIVCIVACIMIFPLTFFFVNSVWYTEPIENTKLTTNQVAEICEKLKFDLTPEETVVTRYWPGFMYKHYQKLLYFTIFILVEVRG